MRLIAALLLCVFALPAFAAKDAVVTFGAPNTGGTPAGYRIYRDNVLVGPVQSGQTLTGFFPTDTGSFVVGVEAHNAACGSTGLPACSRVNQTVVLGVPLQPPGPVINVVIDAPCAKANPPTCTLNISTP